MAGGPGGAGARSGNKNRAEYEKEASREGERVAAQSLKGDRLRRTLGPDDPAPGH